MRKTYSVVLEEEVVDQLKKDLIVGQKFSPVVNELIKNFNKKKKD